MRNGTDYLLFFKFNKQVYNTKLSTIPNEFLNNDSLAYLKILPYKPQYFKYVEIRVPQCFSLDDSPIVGWKELPVVKCK
jgi:hypothetical protein